MGGFGLDADESGNGLNSSETPAPSIGEVFACLSVGFLLTIAAQLSFPDAPGKWKLLILGTVLVLPTIAWAAARKVDFRTVFRWRRTDFRIILAGGIIGLGLCPFSDELDRLVQQIIPMPANIIESLGSMMRFKSPQEMAVLILALVIVAPVGEELLFRGILQGTLEKSAHVNKAIFSTALVFTFVHFNPWWTLEILITALLLGVLAWRSNSILPCIAMHAVTNGISFVVLNTGSRKLQWYEFKGHVGPHWIAAGAVMVVVGFKIVYQLTAKEFHREPNP